MTSPTRTPSLAAAVAALALAAAGCADQFTPASVVENRRVLTLVADPPALDATSAGATTTVRAVEAQPIAPSPIPAGAALERRWSFCPFTLGPSTGYACAVPQCEGTLTADPDGSVTVEPRREAEACLAALGGGAPPDLLGGLPALVEVLVRWRLVQVEAGRPEVILREAVQRVPVWTQPPTAPLNRLPGFADGQVPPAPAVEIGPAGGELEASPCATPDPVGVKACPSNGLLRRGGTLGLVAAVDPATIEPYQVGDRTTEETFAVAFFTTAGRFDEDRGVADRLLASVGVLLKHEEVPAGTEDALVWVVLRDLRGGQAARGPFRIEVERP